MVDVNVINLFNLNVVLTPFTGYYLVNESFTKGRNVNIVRLTGPFTCHVDYYLFWTNPFETSRHFI